MEKELAKITHDTIKLVRVTCNEQLKTTKLIQDTVKMQIALSARMDRAEKEAREQHEQNMADHKELRDSLKEFRAEVRASLEKLNGRPS